MLGVSIFTSIWLLGSSAAPSLAGPAEGEAGGSLFLFASVTDNIG